MSCSQILISRQLKVTALSTKNLQGLHSATHEKVDKLLEKAENLDMETKLDKKRFIRPISEKVEAIEKIQEQQQSQITEVLQNQASQKLNWMKSNLQLNFFSLSYFLMMLKRGIR